MGGASLPDYVYRAKNERGAAVFGRASGESRSQVVDRLREQGLYVTEIEPDRDILQALRNRPLAGRATYRDLGLFCRQLGTMLAAGIPVVSALNVLHRQIRSRVMSNALSQAIAEVQSGVSVAGALGKHPQAFPPVMVSTIAAGEAGGMLDEVLERLAVYFEKQDALRQKVRNALIYPAVVTGMSVITVIVVLVFVVPMFAGLFAEVGAALPGPTRLLLALSGWTLRFWYIPLAGAGLLALGVGRWRSTARGALALDRLMLAVPVFGEMLAKQSLARFSRTLSTLLRSGVPILTALAVLEPVTGNKIFAGAVREAQAAVRDGRTLSAALKGGGVFPAMMLEMVSTGERAGALEEMLARVADFYERELDRLAERLTAVIEPVLIVGLGLVVGGILVAVVLPMFDIFTKLPG